MSMGKFHFTKNTVEASIWCNACNRETPWKILNGKRAYCIPCYDAKKSQPEEKIPDEQMKMF
jgi:hypothetical protein